MKQSVQTLPSRPHSVALENREHLTMTGITDVLRYDEREIEAVSEGGPLTVFGENLHIAKLNLEAGQLAVDGLIRGLEYAAVKKGLFSRLFR